MSCGTKLGIIHSWSTRVVVIILGLRNSSKRQEMKIECEDARNRNTA